VATLPGTRNERRSALDHAAQRYRPAAVNEWLQSARRSPQRRPTRRASPWDRNEHTRVEDELHAAWQSPRDCCWQGVKGRVSQSAIVRRGDKRPFLFGPSVRDVDQMLTGILNKHAMFGGPSTCPQPVEKTWPHINRDPGHHRGNEKRPLGAAVFTLLIKNPSYGRADLPRGGRRSSDR
jgi:hypothetical protein